LLAKVTTLEVAGGQLRIYAMSDYLRHQAVMYRKLAEQADDPFVKNEMLELA
jgi:hypothetical protein